MFFAPLSLFLKQGAKLPSLDQFLVGVNASIQSEKSEDISALFEIRSSSDYLFQMAKRQKNFKDITATMIPSPPGWKRHGDFWIIFSAPQDIEQDHDPVYSVVRSATSFKIGTEIQEDDLSTWRIQSISYKAKLFPEKSEVAVDANISVKRGFENRALPFRLGNWYSLDSSTPHLLVESPTHVSYPKQGDTVRCGSLLIPWTESPKLAYEFQYKGTLKGLPQDVINNHEAYVTAWWLPSLGRLPYTVDSTITGPAGWQIRAEGKESEFSIVGGDRIVHTTCNLPISYPKILGGNYTQEAFQKVGKNSFKIWQLPPLDKAAAERDLKKMVEAAQFYEKTLGPLPLGGYECYDSDSYYGIESYSHTLLNKSITHFISHEMGHSYFGGLAPCPYVHDSWNEGLTEYIDSVVLLGDADHSLENMNQSISDPVALNNMPVAWGNEEASYYRGCYVMKMLESVIGKPQVLLALKQIATQRIGDDTRWDDLRQYFENQSHKDLKWFWNQWVDNGIFPKVTITSSNSEPKGKIFNCKIGITQRGTQTPFILKFKIVAQAGDLRFEKVVDLTTSGQMFEFETPFQPKSYTIDPFPLSIVHL